MAVVSLTLGAISPSYNWFYRILLFEIYLCAFVFFVFDLYDKSQYYISLAVIGCGVMFMTTINWMFYPLIVRYETMSYLFSLFGTFLSSIPILL